jgi:UDP-N-acetylglucosamine--N-acetylmuramyl-(pentapeptide) pyrophosphoryl-undecaprenol N-acetylglucosamine transferase
VNVLLAAGGTGGHLFPAAALAAALRARGVETDLATDDRALKYGGDFPARAIHAIPSGTTTRAGLVAKGQAALQLGLGVVVAARLIRRLRPAAVIGFGGYPTVPPLVAASLLGVPTILHEQNAVLGRANRFLSGRVTGIATGFPNLGGVAPALQSKLRHTGNPVRPAVRAAAALPFPDFADGRLKVLVTGGSQGARVMAEVAPAALACLNADERARLHLTLQARGEDRAAAQAACAALGFAAEIAEFFPDLPARMAGAHLVVARAGASTVSELAVIGRACVLVPYPHALDQDQAANAALLAETGAATVVRQSDFTPDALSSLWRAALADPAALAAKADAARQAGVPDAAERLAALVVEIVQG